MSPPFDGSFWASEHVPVSVKRQTPNVNEYPTGSPRSDDALRYELLQAARTLQARASSSAIQGQELERLARGVRAALRGQPLRPKEREAHAKALLFSYCEGHTGEGPLTAAELKTAAAVVARALANEMPELGDRAEAASKEIARLIQARAAVRRRGRPQGGGLEFVAQAMESAPHIDEASKRLCLAMGWPEALASSVKRSRRRKKK